MLTRNALLICLIACSSPSFAAETSPNLGIIRQVEQLIETIAAKDKVQRRALTVKLANLHYAEALRIAAEDDITDADNQRQLEKHQKLAAKYYEKFVSGDSGQFDPPYGEQLETARLQLSHMYNDLGDTRGAEKIWKDLVKKDEYPAIMSEAALSLAEIYESEDAASDDALELYQTVVKTNKKLDTIQYANYRSAWIQRNRGDFEKAIETLRKCVYDSNGVAKEEVIGDIIVFYSLSAVDQNQAYLEIKGFSEKLQRPELIKQLADAYIAAGNKIAAVAILKKVAVADVASIHSIRLLEESYGLRDWDTFDATLDRLKTVVSGKNADEKFLKETHTVLRRLAIQLDAERVTIPELTAKFTTTVDLFAAVFPSDEIIEKMVSGAVMAETETAAKIKRINAILANNALAVSNKQKLVLREQLVHLYQEQGDHTAAASQSGFLAINSADAKDKRRFKFVQASELYDQEKEQEALTLFKELINESPIDEIGRKSQLLATRYLGRTKKYGEALALTTPWLSQAGSSDAAGSNEFKEISELHEKIVFEHAVELGEAPQALATFLEYCRNNRFIPNSCDNAETLAVKLKRYDDVLALLQANDRHDDVLAILESSGRFEALAEKLEKQLTSSTELSKILRVALLWELTGALSDRNRVLTTLVKSASKNGFVSDAEENLVFTTLYDADLLNKASLDIKWNESNHCYIVHQLVSTGDISKSMRQKLLSCKSSPGKAWNDIVFSDIENLDQKHRKISFYGNGSKKKFERRIAAINSMLKEIDKFLPATDHEGFVKLAGHAVASLNDFAIEIETTPLPEEATEDMIPEITAALSEMAQPFRAKADGYQELIDAENKKFSESTSEKPALALTGRPSPIDRNQINGYLKMMNNDPDSVPALKGLLTLFEKNGHKRPAAYIQGRLSVLKVEGEKPATH